MEIKNLCLITHVIGDKWGVGNWKAALDEAKLLTEKFEIPVKVNYAGQYFWIVTKDTDIEEFKKQRVVVGV